MRQCISTFKFLDDVPLAAIPKKNLFAISKAVTFRKHPCKFPNLRKKQITPKRTLKHPKLAGWSVNLRVVVFLYPAGHG